MTDAGSTSAAFERPQLRGGLAAPATAESMGLAEVAQLLFQGGLSTSPAVSEFSGRGVGLDVVRATATRLKGEAGLRSDAGTRHDPSRFPSRCRLNPCRCSPLTSMT